MSEIMVEKEVDAKSVSLDSVSVDTKSVDLVAKLSASLEAKKIEPWTPEQRNEFIETARNSENPKGHNGPYNYKVFPKLSSIDIENEDPKKKIMTEVLANVIYNTNPAYRAISLRVYDLLIQKIVNHSFLYQFFWNDMCVMLKGSNAYTFLLEEKFPEDFNFSDLDIVIYINPHLPKELFTNIKDALSTIVLQTISQYKRNLDHLFFINKNNYQLTDSILNPVLVNNFKKDFNKAVSEIKYLDGKFSSPFENDEIRNYVSRNSCVLVESNKQDDSVVRVEIPHFNKCERIPLRKTPIFGSYNTTIQFNRIESSSVANLTSSDVKNLIEKGSVSKANIQGDFDLYRIRFNCLYTSKNEDGTEKKEKVTADLIDISISAQDDSELSDFWNRGRSVSFLEKHTGLWLRIPDMETCMNDLNKMINLYDSNDNKKDKREAKFNKLKNIANGLYQF